MTQESKDTRRPSSMAKLCHVCEQVIFLAILTPREWNQKKEEWTAIVRAKWTGNWMDPSLEWTDFGKTKRTAYYDELSESTQSSDEEDGSGLRIFERPEMGSEKVLDVDGGLAAQLSDIED